MSDLRIDRRTALQMAGAVATTSLVLGTGVRAQAAKQVPITIVINQSPWFDELPQDRRSSTRRRRGNKVNLDVNPFAGSLEKQRNSVRAEQGPVRPADHERAGSAEMYFGGFVDADQRHRPGFKLDPDISTFDDTVYFDAATKTQCAEAAS